MYAHEMILLILGIIAFVVISAYLDHQRRSGKAGEKWVSRNLNKFMYAKVIDDLTLQISDDKTRQIDHLLICDKGIFVVETKDHKGAIIGDDNWQQWTQSFGYAGEYKMYNPTKQSAGQAVALRKELDEMGIRDIPVYSFVVFTRAELRITSKSAGSFADFTQFANSKNSAINDNQVNAIYEKLSELKANSTVTNKQHVANINKMLDKIDANICPRCNSALVLRNGRYGEFYGCSKYPSCKFIKKDQA